MYSSRIDSAERFPFLFMYSSTQFCTKRQSIFRMKKVDYSLIELAVAERDSKNAGVSFSFPFFSSVLPKKGGIFPGVLSGDRGNWG